MNLVHDLISSRTFNKWLPRVAGLVLIAGVIAFFAVRHSNTATPIDTPVSNKPAAKPKPEPATVALDPAAKRVAARFIHTAVSGRNLAAAWKIAGPSIRQGQSYKSWLAGNIAVVPYPAGQGASVAVRFSHRNRVELEWGLNPRKGVNMKPQAFLMDLVRIGRPGHKHWVVDYWTPLSVPAAHAPN
jgi:hypothetical protein